MKRIRAPQRHSRQANVLRRHVLGKPHAVGRNAEFETIGRHPGGVRSQNNRLAAALAYFGRRLKVGREVHVVAVHLLQALGADHIEEAFDRSMEEHFRRIGLGQLQVDFGRMPLIGPNALARLVQSKPPLVIFRNDLLEFLTAERKADLCCAGQQVGYANPAARRQTQPQRLGLVPQMLAQEFADRDESFVHRLPVRKTRSRLNPPPRFRPRTF